MNRVLITGSSGFIGVNLIKYLNEKLLKIIPFSRANGLDYNLINYKYLNKEKVNTIVHLAGKAHDLKNLSSEQDYFNANTQLTISIFDAFLKSNASTFIFFSSVKAAKDHLDFELTENIIPNPVTYYGKSKLAAENHLLSNSSGIDKHIYILRPCMIHGPGNKGNLNLLYNLVSKQIPWPLGSFDNKRSFCSIENLCFVVNELINKPEIPTGIYNIADDKPLSTNQIIELIGESQSRTPIIFSINKNLISLIAKVGDFVNLPLNTQRLTKLTESFVVNNIKIKTAIEKELPVSTEEGLIKTFQSFNK